MDVLKKTWEYFKPYKWMLFTSILFGFIVIFAYLLNPYIIKLVFDRVYNGGEYDILIPLLAFYIIQTIVKHFFRYSKSLMHDVVALKASNHMRRESFRKFFSLSFESFNKEQTGPLLAILSSDIDNLRNLYATTIPNMLESLFSFSMSLVFLFSLSPKMAWACLIVIPLTFLVSSRYAKHIRPGYVEIRAKTNRLNTIVQENINGVRIVRSFAREDYEKKKMERESTAVKHSHFKLIYIWARNFWKLQVMSNYPTVLLFAFGGVLAIQGEITIGTFVAFSGYTVHIINAINLLPNYINNVQNALVSGEKFFHFIEMEPKITTPELPKGTEDFKGDIFFDNVTVKHDRVAVLKNINLSVPIGKKLGILGATSSGKTTLVSLIGRFFDPSCGRVLLDGVDLREYDLKALRRKISFAMQDIFLFSDTITQNIAFDDPNLPMEKVIAAAAVCDAKEFIEKMPQQYETIIGERGMGLSGGQKQRVSIARAVLKDAPILVMDDTTSALDMETEQVVLKNILEPAESRTQIIIAHRISSVKHCDEIIMLERGEIIERGTHESLMASDTKYKALYEEQHADIAKNLMI